MGQRNMLCTNQMLDLEMDQQGQEHLPPEPCILLGNITDFSHPNVHPGLSVSGNTSNHGFHHATGHHDSSLFIGSQYNSFQHPITNIDFGVAAPPSFYSPYMIPPSASRVYPVSLNHGSSNHLPSSSSPGLIGFDVDNYERSNHFMDFISRTQGKRKNADGVSGSYPHLNDPASSSSSSTGTQLNTMPHQWEEQYESGTAMSEFAACVPAEPRSSGISTVAEGLAERSVRSRSSTAGLQLESSLAHNQNNLLDGSYMSQPFQPESSSAWVEQQFGSNGNNGVPSTWNHASPYIHGRTVNGCPVEINSMDGQGYQDTTSSRNSAVLFHSPPMHHHYHHQFHHHHHPLPPVQAMRGHNYNYHNQVQLPPYRHPTNYILHHASANPSRDGLETGPRHPRPFPSNGLRIYRPHRSGAHQSTSESRNHPHLRILSTDEVAILEIPGFYEVGSLADQHRDMRLDIDDMSYEELLALGERIGSVKTGLSEETILRQLKTRMHVSSGTCSPMDESDGMEREAESCIICQVEYRNQEKIGTLDCGHEYHADCIKQWLLVKNVCPICKISALTSERTDNQ